MTRRPRGYCLVINIMKFRTESPERRGAEYDEKALKELFGKDLNFIVHVKRDLTKHEMENILADYGRKDHKKYVRKPNGM